jgi:hypothetical protein
LYTYFFIIKNTTIYLTKNPELVYLFYRLFDPFYLALAHLAALDGQVLVVGNTLVALEAGRARFAQALVVGRALHGDGAERVALAVQALVVVPVAEEAVLAVLAEVSLCVARAVEAIAAELALVGEADTVAC